MNKINNNLPKILLASFLVAAKYFCAQFIGISFAYLFTKDEFLALCMGSVVNLAYIIGEWIYLDNDNKQ